MALLTSSIGSLPKPQELRHARAGFQAGDLDDDGLLRAERAAMERAIALQQELGLDLLVDGQMDRSDMITCFAERLEGLEVGGLVRLWGNCYHRAARVTGPIERNRPLVVERWSEARAAAGREVRAVLTGPYTLARWAYDEHYGSREACCLAFAEALGAEVAALVEAGATELQLDEPAWGSCADEASLARLAFERATSGVRGRARIWLHVAWGGPGQLSRELWRFPADVFAVELANTRLEHVAALREFPGDRQLAAGVVDVTSPAVESVEEIRRRAGTILDQVAAERLWLVPDAGLRGLSEEAATGKLRALVAAARGL